MNDPAHKKDLPKAKILDRQDRAGDLMVIWIERPAEFDFAPGMYCTVGSGGVERAYSIVSAPHEKAIELFIELVPKEHGGHLTPLLWNLHPGDEVTLRPRAKGKFTFHPDFRNHLLIATVTGIVPYVSYLRDYFGPLKNQGVRAGGHRFAIVHGASFLGELQYADELRALAGEHPSQISYHGTISRPGDPRNHGWTGKTGRANAVCEDIARESSFDPAATLVYACGHPGMVKDVETRMGALGCAVQVEKYWSD